jgi:uncharacterized cupin superfamily protein
MPATEQATSYKLNVFAQPSDAFDHKSHDLDASCKRSQLPLAEALGLTRVGVHFYRVQPHTQSTVVHWHTTEDEWVYVIKAGKGATVRIWDDRAGDTEARDEPVADGDFLAFPAGRKLAHALKAGEEELVFLVGGSRERLDLCHYPELGKVMSIDQSSDGDNWVVDKKNVNVK